MAPSERVHWFITGFLAAALLATVMAASSSGSGEVGRYQQEVVLVRTDPQVEFWIAVIDTQTSEVRTEWADRRTERVRLF